MTLQAINNLTASLAARGIDVVTSEGAPLHIDHLTTTDAQELVDTAAKSYVDWYMLTQVGVPSSLELLPVRVYLGPSHTRPQGGWCPVVVVVVVRDACHGVVESTA